MLSPQPCELPSSCSPALHPFGLLAELPVLRYVRSNLSPLLSSIHLSPLLPSASVTLPSTALGDLPTRQRARIAAAGCWHNVLFAGFVWGVSLLSPLGSERFVGDLGRGVLSVDKVSSDASSAYPLHAMKSSSFHRALYQDSSLYSVLPRGAVITQLDDVPMAASSASTSDDIWTSYLTQPSHLALTENGKIDPHKGWCVPKEWYLSESHLRSHRFLFSSDASSFLRRLAQINLKPASPPPLSYSSTLLHLHDHLRSRLPTLLSRRQTSPAVFPSTLSSPQLSSTQDRRRLLKPPRRNEDLHTAPALTRRGRCVLRSMGRRRS